MITMPSAALAPSSRSPRGASCRAADGTLYRLSTRHTKPLCTHRGAVTLAEATSLLRDGRPHCAGNKSTPARFLANDSAVKPETRDGSRAGTRARKAAKSDAESPIQGSLFAREDLPRRTDAEVEAWLRDLPW